MILITFLFSAFLGLVALIFARRRKRSRILWPLIGVFLGIAVLVPFRAFKIAPLGPDLKENLTSYSILQTKELTIPGYPHAFNPSILPYEEGYLLSFRIKHSNFATLVKKICNVRTSYIGLVRLNRQLEVCGEPYLLNLTSYSDHPSNSAQDARLFKFGEKILLFFNDYGATRHRSSYSLYVTELEESGGRLQPKQRATLLKYEKMLSIEKNWTPFVSHDKLYLIYSSEPQVILEATLETGLCREVVVTETDLAWRWGEIRGGTPGYAIDGGLLTFFHSSKELPANSFFGKKLGRNYAMGAYVFENSPPFRVTKITPCPLGSLEDYTSHNRRKVIFPSGMVLDGNALHVVWGKNDSGLCVTSFDKEKLFSSMEPFPISHFPSGK